MSPTAVAERDVNPKVGIEENNREAVVDLLNPLLADQVMLYTKLRKYHWNVVGPNFRPLHDLFEEQYSALEVMIDDVAERIRALGGIAIGTLSEFSDNTSLQESPGENPDAVEMVRELLSDSEAIIKETRVAANRAADNYGDTASENMLADMLEQQEKMAWMLRAHLE
ncbi:MAG: DNA starvation/stationary phase protection protein [Candidatus Marinimicrobia bacterium]|nr:DNA starvation/stationary phase protection protein [Candidatus Neomarinimicrobiota bacterium]